MGGAGDSRGPMDIDPDIAFRGDERLAGVHSDSDADRALRKSVLPFACCVDGIAGPRERIEERISLRVHLDPAAVSERRTRTRRCSARTSA